MGTPQSTADEKKKSEPDMELTVLRQDRVVEWRQGGNLILSFPISPGTGDNPSPAGIWKVDVISWMPEFRWDKSMWEDGQRSAKAYLLPSRPTTRWALFESPSAPTASDSTVRLFPRTSVATKVTDAFACLIGMRSI